MTLRPNADAAVCADERAVLVLVIAISLAGRAASFAGLFASGGQAWTEVTDDVGGGMGARAWVSLETKNERAMTDKFRTCETA
jgi:hypothetical protein